MAESLCHGKGCVIEIVYHPKTFTYDVCHINDHSEAWGKSFTLDPNLEDAEHWAAYKAQIALACTEAHEADDAIFSTSLANARSQRRG